VNLRIHRAMLDGCAGRIRAEIVAAFPVGAGPDRPGAKAAAAIRADILENAFDTRSAKGAFE